MRMHWMGVNTAEEECDLEDTALHGVQSETHRGEIVTGSRSAQRAPEQISAQNASRGTPRERRGERRDTGRNGGSRTSTFK